jgi:reactive intermediate/imine deaminase
MSLEYINTDKAPKATGHYSQAVKAGRTVYISGQIPLDPVTGIRVTGGITTQTQRVLDNIKAIAEAAGGSMDKIVKTTVYLRSIENAKYVNAVYESNFTGNMPARSTLGVLDLPRASDVEIEAVMYLD